MIVERDTHFIPPPRPVREKRAGRERASKGEQGRLRALL